MKKKFNWFIFCSFFLSSLAIAQERYCNGEIKQDQWGVLYYPNGQQITDIWGSYYPNGQRISDIWGQYYPNGQKISDNWAIYYPNGQYLLETMGCYKENGNKIPCPEKLRAISLIYGFGRVFIEIFPSTKYIAPFSYVISTPNERLHFTINYNNSPPIPENIELKCIN